MRLADRMQTIPWPALGVMGMVILMSLLYGFQYLYQGERQAVAFQGASVIFLLALAWLTWYASRNWVADGDNWQPPRCLGLGLMTLAYLMTVYFYSDRIGLLPWPVVAALPPVLAWAAGLRWGARGSTVVLGLCALALYVGFVFTVPHTQGANMLEVIEAAAAEFAKGENPYRQYDSIAAFPFPYLPGLWLPYAALSSAGIEMRILNLAVLLVLTLLFEKLARDNGQGASMLGLTYYPFILSPPVAQMVMHGHIWPYWLLIVLCAWFLLRQRLLAAGLLFGLMLGTRQPVLFLAAPLAAYAYRSIGLAGMFKVMAVAGAAALVLYLPFALWVGQPFWDATFFSLMSLSSPDGFLVHFSGRSLLYALGLDGMAGLLQIAVTIGAVVLIIRRPSPPSGPWILFLSGTVYAWLIAFGAYAFRYEYIPAFWLILFALVSASNSPPRSAQATRPNP